MDRASFDSVVILLLFILATEEAVFRVGPASCQRLHYLLDGTTIVIFFEIADVLVNQHWFLRLLVPILEYLCVFAHLDVQLWVILLVTPSLDLKINAGVILGDWLSCEVVHLCRSNLETFRVGSLTGR